MSLPSLPPALRAAELPGYERSYGLSVRAMDRSIGDAPGHEDLIDLTHGDTRAFVPPRSAFDDFCEAVRDNTEAYTPYRGSTKVRGILAPRLTSLLGRSVDPARELILTPGTQGGLFAALTSVVSPGDGVLYPSVEYFMNERISAYLGATSHRLAVRGDERGLLHVDDAALDEAERSRPRVLLLSHPNNPTGGIYERDSAQRLAAFAVKHDLVVILDQLYCRQVFSEHDYIHLGSLPGMAERTVTLVGPSKTESMSGYRVGAAVGPSTIIDAMEQVMSLASLRTAGYVQHTLRHWMDDDTSELEIRVAAHQEIRDDVLARLRAIDGVKVNPAAGSSYVFPDVSGTRWVRRHGTNDDYVFSRELKGHGVLVSPGYQFGVDGRGHFRINFSQGRDRLARAIERISDLACA